MTMVGRLFLAQAHHPATLTKESSREKYHQFAFNRKNLSRVNLRAESSATSPCSSPRPPSSSSPALAAPPKINRHGGLHTFSFPPRQGSLALRHIVQKLPRPLHHHFGLYPCSVSFSARPSEHYCWNQHNHLASLHAGSCVCS